MGNGFCIAVEIYSNFELRYKKPDNTHAIDVLECPNETIVFTIAAMPLIGKVAKINKYRKGRPETQILSDRSSGRAENSQVETEW